MATENGHDDTGSANEETLSNYSGTEQFLIGLSPQYWAHTPMTALDLCTLGIVNGVNCFVVKTKKQRSTTECCNGSSTSSTLPNNATFIPVSKCHIQGMIVNVERKSNGSVLYLVDDGTGFVDCIDWNDTNSTSGLYSLPPLLESPSWQDTAINSFRVGDMVQIKGKIKCISIGDVQETVMVHEKSWDVRNGIREVHINLMEHVTENNGINAESEHMLRCIHMSNKASQTQGMIPIDDTRNKKDQQYCSKLETLPSHNNNINNDNQDEDAWCSEMKHFDMSPMYNGAQVLDLLGTTIAKQVSSGNDLPSADDTNGAWRVFGIDCRCTVPYKESLLYCHCQASMEALDPHFMFRDAVLSHLLQMEQNDVPLLGTTLSKRPLMSEDAQLHFQYQSLVHDPKLESVAKSIVTTTRTTEKKTTLSITSAIRRMYSNTFRALRKDGILYLLDVDKDIYLLISRERVLEPFMRRLTAAKDSSFGLERQILQSQRPSYLENVPNSRLQYVKKSLNDAPK